MSKQSEIFFRKQKIWNLLTQGFSQQQIAEKLQVSLKTVSRDFKEIKKESMEWMEALPKGEIQVYYKTTFDLINASINEMWKLFEKTEDEKLKLNILRTITEKCKLRIDLLDPNRLLKIRNIIHDELSPRNPFSGPFDNKRTLIDFEKMVGKDNFYE